MSPEPDEPFNALEPAGREVDDELGVVLDAARRADAAVEANRRRRARRAAAHECARDDGLSRGYVYADRLGEPDDVDRGERPRLGLPRNRRQRQRALQPQRVVGLGGLDRRRAEVAEPPGRDDVELPGQHAEPDTCPHLVRRRAEEQRVRNLAARDPEVAQPDREPLQRKRERQLDRVIDAGQTRVERVGRREPLLADDVAGEQVVDQVERRHDVGRVRTRQLELPEIASPLIEVQPVLASTDELEARVEDVPLDEVHQVDEVRGRAEHRMAVLAVTERLRAEEVGVALESLQIRRRRSHRPGLDAPVIAFEVAEREPRDRRVRRALLGLRLVSRDARQRQTRPLRNLFRIAERERRRGAVAGLQQLHLVESARARRAEALIRLEGLRDHRLRVLGQPVALHLLQAEAVRQVVDREQVQIRVERADSVDPADTLLHGRESRRAVGRAVDHLGEAEPWMQVRERSQRGIRIGSPAVA